MEDFMNLIDPHTGKPYEGFDTRISLSHSGNSPHTYYSGTIAPGKDVVFVFGSNPEGRHGAGAARVAREQFGAIYGQGEGLQGNSYALPTKDLRITENHGYKSISEADIMTNIKKMYECAEQNPDRRFMVAYTNAPGEKTLNGYTGAEMIDMFIGADGGRIPSNVIFSEAWKDEMEKQLTRLSQVLDVADEAEMKLSGKRYDELKSEFSHFWDDNLKVTKDFEGFYDNMVEAFKETQGQNFGQEGYAEAERFVAEMENDMELMDYLTRSLNYSAAKRSQQRNYEGEDINIYFSSDEHKELSNLAIRRFDYKPVQGSDVLHFSSVEQAYQYMKTFHSDASADVLEDYRKKILDAGIYSGMAKKLGSSIPGIRKEEWEAASVEYMRTFVRESFRNNAKAQEALLATSGHRLTHNQDRGRWNQLFPAILMEVRDMLETERKEAVRNSRHQDSNLYVSYYWSKSVPKDAYVVQISTTAPKDVTPDFQFRQTYPSWNSMVGPHRDGTIDDKGYTERYVRDVLDRHRDDILETVKKIKTEAKGRDIYFMCYEKPGDFCHRYLFNNFLNENGIVCQENPADRQRYQVGRVPLYGEPGYGAAVKESDRSVQATREIDGVRLEESSSTSYATRTYENARNADYTVAFAVDFTTSGEICTAKAAGNSLVKIKMGDFSDESVRNAAEYLVSKLSNGTDKTLALNIAGNGIKTLDKHGISQDSTDSFVTKVLASAIEMGLKIGSIRSGGQTGADEAGIVAATVLGIPAVIRAPGGYKYMDERGVNHYGKEGFMSRFEGKDVAGIRKSVDICLDTVREIAAKVAATMNHLRNDLGAKEIYPFRDGWALFRQSDGKMNYVSPEGNTFFRGGVDKAKEFKDGLTQVMNNGEVFTYNSQRQEVSLEMNQGMKINR